MVVVVGGVVVASLVELRIEVTRAGEEAVGDGTRPGLSIESEGMDRRACPALLLPAVRYDLDARESSIDGRNATPCMQTQQAVVLVPGSGGFGDRDPASSTFSRFRSSCAFS